MCIILHVCVIKHPVDNPWPLYAHARSSKFSLIGNVRIHTLKKKVYKIPSGS